MSVRLRLRHLPCLQFCQFLLPSTAGLDHAPLAVAMEQLAAAAPPVMRVVAVDSHVIPALISKLVSTVPAFACQSKARVVRAFVARSSIGAAVR